MKEKAMAESTKMVRPGGELDKLAKLLAAENITVEHKPIRTAYFDVKNRVLGLPMWDEMSEALYHMLVLHEVGHALETPADAWKGAIDNATKEHESKLVGQTFQGYMNVVEDARIERKIKTKFPGSRKDFIDGYNYLHDKDFFELANREVDNLSLIDRINLYFKLGTRIRIKFSEEERVFVRRAEQTITFDDVVKLSEDLLAWAKIKKEDEDNRDVSTSLADDEDEDGEGQESDDFDDEDYGDGDESDDSEDTEEDGEEEDSDSEANSPGTKGGKSDPLDGVEEATTDRAMNDRMEELLDQSLTGRDFRYISFPKDITYEPFTYDYQAIIKMIEHDFARASNRSVLMEYRQRLLTAFRSENNNAINYMVKEFEMKKAAVSYARSKQAKTGVIDTNKIHSYKFNDDIFRRLTIEPTGKNHGLVVVLDMSGSMSSSIRGAIDQLVCLTMFCRRVGIPHRVYGFTSVMAEADRDYHLSMQKRKDMRLAIQRRIGNKDYVFPEDDFSLIEMFHEKMSLKDFNTMTGALILAAQKYNMRGDDEFATKNGYSCASNLVQHGFGYGKDMRYFSLGGTPLNCALLVSRDLMKKFRKEKNVQIMNFVCITDGESNCPSYWSYRPHDRGTHYHTSLPHYQHRTDKTTRIFVDEESRVQTRINFQEQHEITGMYARTVRSSQNATFVGFYIVGGPYDVRHIGYRYCNKDHDGLMNQWKKEKGCVVKGMLNFDEFYLIQGGRSLQAQQAKFDAVSDMKKGQLTRAFISAQNKRGASRAVLGRFIQTIAA